MVYDSQDRYSDKLNFEEMDIGKSYMFKEKNNLMDCDYFEVDGNGNLYFEQHYTRWFVSTNSVKVFDKHGIYLYSILLPYQKRITYTINYNQENDSIYVSQGIKLYEFKNGILINKYEKAEHDPLAYNTPSFKEVEKFKEVENLGVFRMHKKNREICIYVKEDVDDNERLYFSMPLETTLTTGFLESKIPLVFIIVCFFVLMYRKVNPKECS